MTRIEAWHGRASEETKRPGDDGRDGFKTDHGKLRYDEIPVDAMAELANVYSHGANKYPPKNWEKGMAWSRPYGALLRHVFAWASGESRDPETGLHHLAQAAWNCFTLMCYDTRGIGENDLTMPRKTYHSGWRPATDKEKAAAIAGGDPRNRWKLENILTSAELAKKNLAELQDGIERALNPKAERHNLEFVDPRGPDSDQQPGDFEDPDPESWPNLCPKFGAACKIGNGNGCSKSCFYFPKRAQGDADEVQG